MRMNLPYNVVGTHMIQNTLLFMDDPVCLSICLKKRTTLICDDSISLLHGIDSCLLIAYL